MKTPTSITNILQSLQSSVLFTWTQTPGSPRDASLSIFHDDYPADRRFVHDIRFSSLGVRITRRVLSGYNKEKHCWENYPQAKQETTLPNRRGEKALRSFLSKSAKEHNCRSLSHFTIYRTAPSLIRI